MLIRGDFTSFSVLPGLVGSLSDHAALYVSVPWERSPAPIADTPTRLVYKWVEGSSLADYSHSWRAWNRYTDSPEFALAFHAIIDAHVGNVDQLT